jgi:hypothetical protein
MNPFKILPVLFLFLCFAAETMACLYSKIEKEYVIAISKNETRYATVKFDFDRDGNGGVEGYAVHCIYKIGRSQPEFKSKKINTYKYGARDGALIDFGHSYFIDKILLMQTQFIRKHKSYQAIKPLWSSSNEKFKAMETLTLSHEERSQLSFAFGLWETIDETDSLKIQKPHYYAIKKQHDSLTIAYFTGRKQKFVQKKYDSGLDKSNKTIFYKTSIKKILLGQFTFHYGSWHPEEIDFVAPFRPGDFKPFNVILSGSKKSGAIKHIRRLFKKMDIDLAVVEVKNEAPIIHVKPQYLPIARHIRELYKYNQKDTENKDTCIVPELDWQIKVNDELNNSIEITVPTNDELNNNIEITVPTNDELNNNIEITVPTTVKPHKLKAKKASEHEEKQSKVDASNYIKKIIIGILASIILTILASLKIHKKFKKKAVTKKDS